MNGPGDPIGPSKPLDACRSLAGTGGASAYFFALKAFTALSVSDT